jgi:hypothetical protein
MKVMKDPRGFFAKKGLRVISGKKGSAGQMEYN